MNTRLVSYQYQNQAYEAFLASNSTSKKPTVLVFHDWSGRNEFACQQAKQLAELGYCGIAVDLYGKGKIGTTNAEKSALMQPLVQDRHALREQLIALYHSMTQLSEVDANQIGVMGFCFGGLCALDAARSGSEIKGAISVHGFLTHPPEDKPETIHAKILALHGYEDPMVSMADASAFCDEMSSKNVDWQLHVFGQSKHAFTNPQANDVTLGLVYNPLAEKRSKKMIADFWGELFNH